MSSAFDKIAAGLTDAIAFAEGDTTRARVASSLDVKRVRAATKKTQSQFAESYRLPIGTVRDWEQNRRQPDAPARVLLSMIAVDPETVESLIAKSEALAH
ncbi:helix-turn-helix domain-containing protein [Sphingomonas sp. Leaf4]|uniref:helix-turn-helix domain-containing protein n=1 Tax=Sphingomonas sp. Leaf4 TaxID=2876553 RepID=UPI001E4AE05B|nr:transcriptional regulator [Sphingomonas sp. Leaf4]